MSTVRASDLQERPFAKDTLVSTGLSNGSEILQDELGGFCYIAFSRGINEKELEQWQIALKKVRSSGTHDILMQKFFKQPIQPKTD
jgi:ABC-type amino acid transport substrate-binding protein